MVPRKAMGEVFADATFYGPAGQETLRLLVDTGSTYTWIPAAVAKRLGIVARAVMPFDLGRRPYVRRRIGEAMVEILERRATRIVVFAGAGEEPVIGHETLQGLLLHVDVDRHRLVPGMKVRAPGRRTSGVWPKSKRGGASESRVS
ncbi:MAG TPA: aspartyl protease family protein [Thermoplasmata archaeon]|jgi:predicted aspartyl protease|nr:aspartyl protease family protein [Thermoplasmata archaeon]